jgi:hypothetical protein
MVFLRMQGIVASICPPHVLGHFKQTGNYPYKLKKKKIPSDQNTENMKFTCRIHSHTKSSDITW